MYKKKKKLTASQLKRKKSYKWAISQKGVKTIMSRVKRLKRSGSDAIERKQLTKIADAKVNFAKGLKAKKSKSKTYRKRR